MGKRLIDLADLAAKALDPTFRFTSLYNGVKMKSLNLKPVEKQQTQAEDYDVSKDPNSVPGDQYLKEDRKMV